MSPQKVRTNIIVIAVLLVLTNQGVTPSSHRQSSASDGKIETALSSLTRSYPGVQYTGGAGRVTSLYGSAFGSGGSPEETAERFVQEYSGLFGVSPGELVAGSRLPDHLHTQPVMYNRETDSYKFTLVYYRQFAGDLPVFRSELRLLVRNESGYPMVLAKSSLHDLAGFVSRGTARAALQDVSSYVQADNPSLFEFDEPRPVIWAGTDDSLAAPREAIQVVGSNDVPEVWLYVIDAETGEVLFKEDQIIFETVSGNVSGYATMGVAADNCTEETLNPLPWALVEVGASSVYTDSVGHFAADVSIIGSVDVQSYTSGAHFSVNNMVGANAVLERTTDGSGDVDFTHNESNTDEFYRAQVNAYVSANQVRDFVLDYNPVYPGVRINSCSDVYVNRTDTYCPGNAWYNALDASLNFCLSGYHPDFGVVVPNSAYNGAVHHEYGHHLVRMAGSGQWQYGEGMSDVIAMLIADDPRLAIGFLGDCSSALRTALNEMQFPCTFMEGGPHYCGQLLSGAIWDLRDELFERYPTSYLDTLANLTVNSILLHIGDYISPQIVIDFLTLDDDDPDITNGTPHTLEICGAFSAHNLRCPEFRFLDFVFSEEIPDYIGPDSNLNLGVEILPRGPNQVIQGAGQFFYAVDDFDYAQGTMVETAPNVYSIVFPDTSCGSIINWYLTAESDRFGTVTDPYYYDSHPYKIIVATDKVLIFQDDFNQNRGWSFESVNNLGGNWDREIPISGPDVYGSPESDYDGSGYCYLTENSTGASALRYGTNSLISPNLGPMDGITRIEFARWWHNSVAGMYPFPDDPFEAYVSGDNGATWIRMDSLDPYYSDHLGGWFTGNLVANDVLDASSATRFRFDAINYETYPMNLVEVAIDDVRVYAYLCTSGLTIYTPAAAEATVGAPYACQLESIGGIGIVSWADKFNELAGSGLSLSSSGLISGTPVSVGAYGFTALASDTSGQSTEKVFSVHVNSGLEIIDNFVDEWTFACHVRHHFEVVGGTPPYSWTNPSGNLETDIANQSLGMLIHFFGKWVNGEYVYEWGLYGNCSYEDSIWFSLAVTDAAGAKDTIRATIFTNDRVRVLTEVLPDATVGEEYYAQVDFTGGTAPYHWWDLLWSFENLGLDVDSLTGEITGTPHTPGTFDPGIILRDTANCYWRSDWDTTYPIPGHYLELTIAVQEGCGDFNTDGVIDMSDLTYLIAYLFIDGPAPDPIEMGDFDSTGAIDIGDLTLMIDYLFLEGEYPHCSALGS